MFWCIGVIMFTRFAYQCSDGASVLQHCFRHQTCCNNVGSEEDWQHNNLGVLLVFEPEKLRTAI
jgi:hypothetical protein